MALPIDEVLPKLLDALHGSGRAVLEAPPGAGKTTGVPLALSADGRFAGRIIVLEPRRLAARAAADRMAEQLGEKVGGQVGYRIRGESKVGPATRIELVTEGVFTAMIQDAPDLPGIGTVIFDEFHERSLQADLGLALAWEARTALRPDLNILVMSATLDAAPIAALLDGAPRITAAGRSYPIETVWRDQPARKDLTLSQQVASLVDKALEAGNGGILAFLPGEREIRDTTALLNGTLPDAVALYPLYGALPFAAQRAAVAPEPGRRKLVLATAIAETSLTIEDISIVIDGGQARRMRFDPGSGMGRLVTEPISRAEAEQRRGRAGRLRPGLCFRNWTRAAEGALPEFAPPEVLRADLSDLALQLARWGSAEGLAFLTPPPQGAMARSRALLHALGGLDAEGRITNYGQAMAKLPAHPRLAHMLLSGGPEAANLAALLSAVDPMRNMGADLGPRLRSMRGKATGKLAPILQDAKRLSRHRGDGGHSAEVLVALAYPDRIALRRTGDEPRYLLSGGRGAKLPLTDPLAQMPFLAVADLDGGSTEAQIRRALPITEKTLRRTFGDRIAMQEVCRWSTQKGRVIARRQEQLGALVLSDVTWSNPPEVQVTAALLDGLRGLGIAHLNWSKKAKRTRARMAFAGVTAVNDATLMASLESWAAPYLQGLRTAEDLAKWDPAEALLNSLDWPNRQALDREAPAQWTSPLGREVAIDYTEDGPEVALRLQEVLGTTVHPVIGPDRLPLRFVLLSPAGRPIQVTQDLPGFWAGSYGDVRKEMRARYPKHHWPEAPSKADPTLRPKARS